MRSPKLPVWTSLTALLALTAGAAEEARAQTRTSENVVTQAEDAFGTSIGRESIGLYNSSNVRGFSPTAAGNARIDGLYFDQVWGLSGRLRQSTTIRIGLSAFGFPFPAPTGVIDYQLRRPGDAAALSTYFYGSSYGDLGFEADAVLPVSDTLTIGAGLGLYRNEFSNGTDADQHVEALMLRWRPNAAIEILPFWNRSYIADDEIGPVYIPAGTYLPPRVERRQFNGPDWAIYEGAAINYGVLASYTPAPDWRLRAGVFGSIYDNETDHYNFIVDLTPAGEGVQQISADPDTRTASTSGEVRLTRSFTEGSRLHLLHVSMRGRERDRVFGGSDLIDLGLVTLGDAQVSPQPVYNFTEQTRDGVRQWLGGIAYEGRWRNRGELSFGLSYTDYEKRTRQPGLAPAITCADPWLWNGALAVNLTSDLVAYAGYTTGLEESGVAPQSAVNRAEALAAIETEQREAGVRWQITEQLRLVAGVFEVRKPYFNLDELSVWRELGEVENRGLEVSLSGNLRPNFSIVAGAVLLDAEVTGEAVSLGRVGPLPVGSTRATALLSLDWSPDALDDVSFDMSASYSDDVVATRDNAVVIPARTLLNLGARYRFTVAERAATLRVQVTNVTDEFGWELRGGGAYDFIAGRVFTVGLAADF
jgi:iron complex outermembrane receptor protein